MIGCVALLACLGSCAGSDGHIRAEQVVSLQELAEHSVLRIIPTPNTSPTVPTNAKVGIAIYLLPDKEYWERRGVCPVMGPEVHASLDELDVPLGHPGGYVSTDTCWRGYFGMAMNLPPFDQSTYATELFGRPELTITVTDGDHVVRYRAPNFLDAVTATIVSPGDGTVKLGGRVRIRYSVSVDALPNVLVVDWPCPGGGFDAETSSLVVGPDEIEFGIPSDCPLGVDEIFVGTNILPFTNFDVAFQAEELECAGVTRCELFRQICGNAFCDPASLSAVTYTGRQTFTVDFQPAQ